MAGEFTALVRDKWSPLLTSGFNVARDENHILVLESADLVVSAVHDPRGELDVTAFRRGTDAHHGWKYTGIVGRASLGRLLEIALERMQGDPAILGGDSEFYAEVERQSRARSEALTKFYSRPSPRPRGPLP